MDTPAVSTCGEQRRTAGVVDSSAIENAILGKPMTRAQRTELERQEFRADELRRERADQDELENERWDGLG